MTFNKTESAIFQQESDKTIGELQTGVKKALDEAAAKGFPAPPGSTLAAILEAGQAVKGKLCEVNAKIYEGRRKTLFEQNEFAMKVIVQLAKLGMELYREELMNALAIEVAENESLKERGLADVARMNSEVEARQVSIIRAQAEMEHRIAIMKGQLVEAERANLVYEAALINAQLATAAKKLEIIASIYQIIAAEELVLAAENSKVAALQELLAAKAAVVAAKQSLIPLYTDKADAKGKLAQAITEEIPVLEAIAALGYDRIAVKTAEEAANHQIRMAEGELERLKMLLARANATTELAKVQLHRLIQEYSNVVKKSVLESKKFLDMGKIDLTLSSSLARTTAAVDSEVEVAAHEVGNMAAELSAIIAGITARGQSQADVILSSRDTSVISHTKSHLSRKIIEGSMGW